MFDDDRSASERLAHGLCGAAMAAFFAVILWLLKIEMQWWMIAGIVFAGFAIGWSAGREAIELVGHLLFWWP